MYSTAQIQLTSAICTSIAIATTLLRLYVRRRALWIDDVFALLSMLFLSAQLGVLIAAEAIPSAFTRSYLVMSTFYATIWCARIGILFTIIRIGKGTQRRRVLSVVASMFIILFAVLVGQIFWVCESQRKRAAIPNLPCVPTKQIALTQLGSDIFADLTLLLSSLQLFLIIQEKALRCRLMFIFATCTATTIVSFVHAAFILTSEGTKIVIAALVEDGVSLVVSSIPVVANIFFQLKERNSVRFSSVNVPLTIKFATNVAALGSASNLFEPPQTSLSKSNTTSLSSLQAPPPSMIDEQEIPPRSTPAV